MSINDVQTAARELLIEIKAGGAGAAAAKARLVALYHPLARNVAHRIALQFSGSSVEVADLVQAGLSGLLEAIETYDPRARDEDGLPLGFAPVHWIRHAALLELNALLRPVRVPAKPLRRSRDVTNVAAELAVRLGREATRTELAQRCGEAALRDRDRVRAIETVSLDRTLDDDAVPLAERLRSDEPDPVRTFELGAFGDQLASICAAALTDKEWSILRLRSGFDGAEHTLGEIAKRYGISEGRVHELEARAKRKLWRNADLARLRALA